MSTSGRDRWWQPFGLVFIWQNQYLHLGDRLIKLIHIWNLKKNGNTNYLRVSTSAKGWWWLFWRPSWFMSIGQNLFIFKLGWEVYGSHQCIKFGRKWLINDQIRVSTSGNQQTSSMVAAILVIVHQKKNCTWALILIKAFHIYINWKKLGDNNSKSSTKEDKQIDKLKTMKEEKQMFKLRTIRAPPTKLLIFVAWVL